LGVAPSEYGGTPPRARTPLGDLALGIYGTSRFNENRIFLIARDCTTPHHTKQFRSLFARVCVCVWASGVWLLAVSVSVSDRPPPPPFLPPPSLCWLRITSRELLALPHSPPFASCSGRSESF
jgi:hypothetical protein